MSLHSSPRPIHTLRVAALAAALAVAAGLAHAQQPADKQLAGLLADQKWTEALALIDTQLKAKPNDAQLLMNRGAVLSSMGRNADALAVFQKVATSNPQLPAAHNNMAVILDLASVGAAGAANRNRIPAGYPGSYAEKEYVAPAPAQPTAPAPAAPAPAAPEQPTETKPQ